MKLEITIVPVNREIPYVFCHFCYVCIIFSHESCFMPITIAFADDHPSLRAALAESLEAHGSFKALVQKNNGAELIDWMKTSNVLPDICILDLSMPQLDGVETLKIIRRDYPTVKVLIFSMYLEEFNLLRVYKHGAAGAFSKDMDLEDLVDALLEVAQKGWYIPKNISETVLAAIKDHRIILPRISKRETEFLRLYCDGLSYKQIADIMGVTVKTIDCYREHLTEKLGIKGRIGLLLFALKTGIIGWKI